MTSRERVLSAIEHQCPDRTPADYGALTDVTDRLIERIGVANQEELLQTLHVDMRRIRLNHNQPDSEPDTDGYVRTMWGARHRDRDPGDGKPNDLSPFNENSSIEDVYAHAWPDPDVLDYSQLRSQCEKHYGDYATYGSPWSPFFHEIGWLIGLENFLVWMTTKPAVVKAIIEHIVDYEVEVTRRFLEAVDGMIDITYFGNDFGTQLGLLISPQMWQEFIRIPLKRFFDISHDYGCKVMMHSCGSIRDVIPYLIEDGVNILDPIQVTATGMQLDGLFRDFGNDLCFHGGIDTQKILPFGSTEDVRAKVHSFIELTRERGGYILCGSQQFTNDIPLDNILTMYDENNNKASSKIV